GIAIDSVHTSYGLHLVDAFVGKQRAAELLLQLRGQAVVALVFASEDEGDLALAQFAGHVAEGLCRVFIAHVVAVAARGEMYADAAGAPDLDQRSEEHTSELQSRENLVCRLLLE